MKSIIAAGILLASASAAVAGPYVNLESNSGRVGNDYTGSVIELHKGYEGQIGESDAGYYVQLVLLSLCLTVKMLRLTFLVKQVSSMMLLRM